MPAVRPHASTVKAKPRTVFSVTLTVSTQFFSSTTRVSATVYASVLSVTLKSTVVVRSARVLALPATDQSTHARVAMVH